MKDERIVDNYNSLVPTMNKLVQEGEDIWEFHNISQGYGFMVIREDKWINVSISHNYSEPNEFFISSYEREGNCFCIVSNKQLGRRRTTNFEEVYSLIKELY